MIQRHCSGPIAQCRTASPVGSSIGASKKEAAGIGRAPQGIEPCGVEAMPAAGSAAEAAGQPRNGMAYTIRLLDGRVVTIVQHLPAGAPMVAVGSRVVVETRGRTQRVAPD